MKISFNKKIIFGLIFVFIVFFGLSCIEAKTVSLGNAYMNDEDTIYLKNTNAPKLVKKPSYSSSNKNTNIIKTKKGNKKYTFKTKYKLPRNAKWSNTQSIVIVGKYMYVVSSTGNNKGFIVRYDMTILNKKKANTAKGRDILDKKISKVKKGVKVGPTFKIGHGQSLAYNPKDKYLYMWQDDSVSTNLKMLKISPKTLKPVTLYKFSLYYYNHKIKTLHNLAFDNDGNFYVDQIQASVAQSYKFPKNSIKIISGQISGNTVKAKILLSLKNRPGTYGQSISYNPYTNRLFLVSDGVFYSLPVDKMLQGTITTADLQYTVLNTKREFEGIAYSSDGKLNLLLVRGPEVLTST